MKSGKNTIMKKLLLFPLIFILVFTSPFAVMSVRADGIQNNTLVSQPVQLGETKSAGSAAKMSSQAVHASSGIPGLLDEFGEDEAFAIVPAINGTASLDADVDLGHIQLYSTHRQNNQLWKLVHAEDDLYYIITAHDGRAVQAMASGDIAGAELYLQQKENTWFQLWRIEDAGDGTFYIRSSQYNDYVFDCWEEGTADRTRVRLSEWHGGLNQCWRFVHVNNPEPESSWGADRIDCYGSDWDVWDGSTNTDWYYENKNRSVFNISTASELAGLSALVRDGICSFRGKRIILTKDINLAGIEWRKIGTSDRPFTGSFNGGGHAITGLAITTDENDNGFFGKVNGIVSNFAIKGSVFGDCNTGGVVGNMEQGFIHHVYSEVAIAGAKDDNAGGICGRLGTLAMIDHCTQNARVNSYDKDPDRGGIAGYACGIIRWCVNRSSVECNWNYSGGIAGELVGTGKIEYCANYGQISGGNDTKYAGGIAGCIEGDSIVFACVNYGYICSGGDDCIGGIIGERRDNARLYFGLNQGTVRGRKRVGGIAGWGLVDYCLNVGPVYGDSVDGSIVGEAGSANWSRGLSYTHWRLAGEGGAGGEWVSAEDIISGKVCYDLNSREDTPDLHGYGPGWTEVFYQNIGGDALPRFSGKKVVNNNGDYNNDSYEVRVEYDSAYGTVTGAGTYKNGEVTITATPADGCEFDHIEVCTSTVTNQLIPERGESGVPSEETTSYGDAEVKITDNIDRSYTVKAFFKVYDEVPAGLRQSVKLELECTDESGGWNSQTIPVYLVDSAGEKHLWEIPREELDDVGEKTSYNFYLGAASPVSVEVIPDFGGGLTFHDLGIKARMWVNGSGNAIESSEIMIRSYPFMSSVYNQDYMSISFSDLGYSTVGILNEDGTMQEKATYISCESAWKAAVDLQGEGQPIIRLGSAWLVTKSMKLDSGELTVDLNGYPMIRTLKKTEKNGELFTVSSGATLNVIDSTPERESCSAFTGGSIQGGRSTNGAGLINVNGILTMHGGALYNGGTTDIGGGIKCDGGTVELDGTRIQSCWSNKATFANNNGGAIAIKNKGKVTLNDCLISSCHAFDYGGGIYIENDSELTINGTRICSCIASDNQGGAVYLKAGNVRLLDCEIQSNRSEKDDGGAIYQKGGFLYAKNVLLNGNYAKASGGAIYIATNNPTHLIGCTLTQNQCGTEGGAIYVQQDYIYMEDCTVTANASGKKGGGILVKAGRSVDVFGRTLIKNNDGTDTMDNLVLEDGSKLYDQGLKDGSEIWLRSVKDTDIELTANSEKYMVSEYQMSKYFHADYGTLNLSGEVSKDTFLSASAFTENNYFLVAGIILLVIAIAAGCIILIRRKGSKSCGK